MRRLIVALAGLCILSTTGAAMAAGRPDIPTGFAVKDRDTLVHMASGTEFPLRVAGFTRVVTRPIDLVGHDVVIAYRQMIARQPVEAKIALVQIVEMTPQEHYLGMKSMVGQYFQGLSFTDIQLESEGPFTPPGMPEGSGYQGRFKASQKGTPYELSLSTVKLGKWDVRLTAAYPSSSATEAREHILRLAATLQQTAPPPAQ